MSTIVTLNGTNYTVSAQGASPPWGDDQADLLLELVSIAQSTSSSSDIVTTSFNLANNVASVANVTGASFDTSLIRGFIFSYSVYRNTNSNEASEVGQLYGTFSTTAGTWEMSQTYAGNAGVTFTITNAGQIQYVSTNISGTSYVGKMKFAAKTFLQA